MHWLWINSLWIISLDAALYAFFPPSNLYTFLNWVQCYRLIVLSCEYQHGMVFSLQVIQHKSWFLPITCWSCLTRCSNSKRYMCGIFLYQGPCRVFINNVFAIGIHYWRSLLIHRLPFNQYPLLLRKYTKTKGKVPKFLGFGQIEAISGSCVKLKRTLKN